MAAELRLERSCTTDVGKFQIKVDPNHVLVGGTRYCVNIAIKPANVTELSWVSTDQGGCSLDGSVIRKEKTVQMVDVAFSLLRQYFPQRTEVTLLDDSGVPFDIDKKRKGKIGLLKAYLFFYGNTYYEHKFGATMIVPQDHAEYLRRKQGFDDPSKKPAEFDFGSKQAELAPLYQASRTWREFAQRIAEAFPENAKYKMIHEWYRQALYLIFDHLEIHQQWKIDVTRRPMYPCQVITEGGRHRGNTRKKSRRRVYYPLEPFLEDRGGLAG